MDTGFHDMPFTYADYLFHRREEKNPDGPCHKPAVVA